MQVQNIIELDRLHGDEWRSDFNGEESTDHQVNCDICGCYEDEAKAVFKLTLNEHNETLVCKACLINMKTLLNGADLNGA